MNSNKLTGKYLFLAPLCQRENFILTGRQSLVSHVNVNVKNIQCSEKHETKMGNNIMMVVKLEADLNADHANEFVIMGEKKGTGHE